MITDLAVDVFYLAKYSDEINMHVKTLRWLVAGCSNDTGLHEGLLRSITI